MNSFVVYYAEALSDISLFQASRFMKNLLLSSVFTLLLTFGGRFNLDIPQVHFEFIVSIFCAVNCILIIYSDQLCLFFDVDLDCA